MERTQLKATPMHFKTMIQTDVPQGREGKHKLIVTRSSGTSTVSALVRR